MAPAAAKVFLFAFVACLLSAAVSAVAYYDCGSTYDLLGVDFAGCENPPCPLVAGSTINVTSTFYAKSASNSVLNDVYFVMNTVQLPATVTSCTCSGVEGTCVGQEGCAIAQGATMDYHAQVLVGRGLPPVEGSLVWEMYNEVQHKIICYKVEVQIFWP
ncbi:uncharacterized protein LOC126337818 [Schistocerca gregaria]|uniref:uncharacterized protein LOC126337818 n=1 Tax=Schistocerca gregaria TaxID=7010 RepID=UPI00211EE88D|nr:uncharacterized protein LOC126337818 [Schistocerca gregaria]